MRHGDDTDLARGSTVRHTRRVGQTGMTMLGIYLNDHLAGATLGSQLASRVAVVHRGTSEAATFERLAAEIAEDRAALVELMATVQVPIRQYKVVLGWVAEKAGRFKPNGRLLARSPLSSLEEIEAMRLGVEGKRACWRTLRVLADRDDRLGKKRLNDLLRRADEQIETLEDLRIRITNEVVSEL
jgi:hypothetical protein